ncbi:MAG TPA: septum formation initiator family protein [Gemmatimonadales bacterium]|nr:septum formation initiator family protein [Gemmatimonadales bacterium]
MTRRRALAVVAVIGGLAFGFAGGEYGTAHWWRMKTDLAAERAALDSLKAELDSLKREVQLLERDPATQERVAREEFGMIRPGELLFLIEGPARER